MENSAQALKIAAGVFMAILLLSLVLYVFGIMSDSENTKRDLQMALENREFNQKFLAFEKSSMYGTDLISILGLAISNNEIENQKYDINPNGMYYQERDGLINIEFILKDEPVTAITTEYEQKKTWNTTTRRYDIEWIQTNKDVNPILSLGKHDLSNDKSDFETIKKIVLEGNAAVETKIKGTKKIETDGSGFENLKKRIFTCTDIGYNNGGKINFIRFEQK